MKANLDVPIIHIADVTAEDIKNQGINKVCFLGAKYTMTQNFIRQRIENKGVEVLVPNDQKVIDELHRIIMEELTYGKINADSKKYVLEVIQSFVDQGVNGAMLGCTAFPLMINEHDLRIPIFNTTLIHTKAGVEYIFQDVHE